MQRMAPPPLSDPPASLNDLAHTDATVAACLVSIRQGTPREQALEVATIALALRLRDVDRAHARIDTEDAVWRLLEIAVGDRPLLPAWDVGIYRRRYGWVIHSGGRYLIEGGWQVGAAETDDGGLTEFGRRVAYSTLKDALTAYLRFAP